MASDLRQFLKDTNGKYFFVMDTETTGFSPNSADVIEVSAIKVKNDNGRFTVVDTFDSFINPGYPLPEEIVKFNERNETGICDELLSSKPKARYVAMDLHKFLGNEPLYVVGHNIDKFDTPFIRKLMMADGRDFDPDTFDTLTFSKDKISGKHNLGVLFEYTDKSFSKGNPTAHLSIGDCYMTLDLMHYLKERFVEKDAVKEATLPKLPKKIGRIGIDKD